MAIKDLQKLLKQVHDQNEYDLVAHDLNHPIHWYFKVENAMMKDLNPYLPAQRYNLFLKYIAHL